MNVIIKAAQFARKAHGGQKRKFSNEPYIHHPARVAARAMLLPETTEALVCAAWLHDVVEDCGVSLQTLTEVFGPPGGLLCFGTIPSSDHFQS